MKSVEALKWRYAVKKFDSKAILKEQLVEKILEALTLTPTSMGMQLLDFLVVSDKSIQEKLLPIAYGQSQMLDASHILVLCRKEKVTEVHIKDYLSNIKEVRGFDEDSVNMQNFGSMLRNTLKMDEKDQKVWMDNQVYIALGNLLTVCAMEKVDACPMEGFDNEALDQALGLKEKGLRSVVLCPIGYRSNEDKYANLPKVRRAFNETVSFLNKEDIKI